MLRNFVSSYSVSWSCHSWTQMANDPQFSNLPLLSAFLKTFNRTYLGQGEDATSQGDGLPASVQELVASVQQVEFRKLFEGYFNAASKTLVKGQTVSCQRGGGPS